MIYIIVVQIHADLSEREEQRSVGKKGVLRTDQKPSSWNRIT